MSQAKEMTRMPGMIEHVEGNILDIKRFLNNKRNLCLIPAEYFTSYDNVKNPISCYDIIINKNNCIKINDNYYFIPSCFVHKNKVFSNEEMFKEYKQKGIKKNKMK